MDSKIESDWFEIPQTKDDDVKIFKRIKYPGELIQDETIKKTEEELRPRIGDRVKIKLVGKVVNTDSIFLERIDEPIEHSLFTGECIRGLDLVLSTMIKGEVCEALIPSEYVDEDEFNEFQSETPRNQNLKYLIELLDWDNEFLSKKNDGGIVRKMLKKGIGYETPVYNSLVKVNLVGYYQVTRKDKPVKFDERRNVRFRLSEGADVAVCRGLESACYKLKVNEKDRVYILNEYGFNDGDCRLDKFDNLNGFDNKLPVHCRLIYEIELISFEIRKQFHELSLKERFELSIVEKDRATEFFKQSKFHLALKCYSDILKAIGPPETNLNDDLKENLKRELTDDDKAKRNDLLVANYNNMALCYLKLGMPKEAHKYVEWALAIDPLNLKAIYRKGLSFYDRNEFNLAIEQFNRCLELDPNNKPAKNQIQLAKKKIQNYVDKEKQIFSNLFK